MTVTERAVARGCGKIAYDTRAEADRAKRHLHEKPGFTKFAKGRSQALNTYHCSHCGSFHLGRQRRGRTFQGAT